MTTDALFWYVLEGTDELPISDALARQWWSSAEPILDHIYMSAHRGAPQPHGCFFVPTYRITEANHGGPVAEIFVAAPDSVAHQNCFCQARKTRR